MSKKFALLLGLCLPAASRLMVRCMLLVSAIFCLGAPTVALSAPAPIFLQESTPLVQAWPSVTVLSDPEKKRSINQVMDARAEFKTPDTAYGTLGLRKDAVWLHIPISVSSQSNGLWVLDIDYPVLNRLDVFVTRDKNIIERATLGSLQPYDQRLIRSRSHSYGLKLKAGTTYDLYLRVESNGAMILPITLSKPAEFHAKALDEQMLQGLLTGLALCLLVYSLAQWVTLREHLYLKYAILILGSLLFSLFQFGIGSQYVWRGNSWMELHAGGLAALIAATGSFLFIEQALAGPDVHPWISRIMKAGAAFTVFFALCFSLDLIDLHIVTAIISALGLAPALLGLPGAISRARRGESVGIYFLLAWAAYFVTTAIMIEVIKGRVGVNFWTLHSFQFGATFDMLVFMRVLGLRTKALQAAVQHARRERDNLHSLAHTDALTGLPNRRGLNSSMAEAIKNAGPEKIVAVYMLDLDGFKQINDQYGHDVGDELLIAVAARLRASVRQRDVISRLGGDEFVVMSSGLHNVQQARDRGEQLLKAFNDPFAVSGQVCRIGLTIGYALAPLDGNDATSILKRADAAMYAGKHKGKHCVRRGDGSGPMSSHTGWQGLDGGDAPGVSEKTGSA
ncbi:MAG: diguanylate cyclase [Rhodoferax sp.]|uniref:diguanylate cyclase n=1 Tax=Rhodoferax sp. TaxID=50421 RepID=UPI0027268061|nr:diguanylate cyclase [Rhodoferax sp.]MDO8450223.1 diguanylate cyclase [Rhodoferax sp.]